MKHLRYFLYNLLVLEAELYGVDEARNRYVERLWAIIERVTKGSDDHAGSSPEGVTGAF